MKKMVLWVAAGIFAGLVFAASIAITLIISFGGPFGRREPVTSSDASAQSRHRKATPREEESERAKEQSMAEASTRPLVASPSRSVIINRALLSDDELHALERQYQVRIQDGNYWYDRVSGAWGIEGGPTRGVIIAGLDLGGPLRRDASNGHTQILVNGRELHYQEALGLQQLVGPLMPGRYWVDAQGNAGYEGGPALCNLVQLAQAASRQPGGGRSVTSGMYDSGIGRVLGDGSYISGDSSVTRP